MVAPSCLLFDITSSDSGEPDPGEIPPEIVDIRIPEWPPLGSRSFVEVEVRAEEGLDTLRFEFIREHTEYITGKHQVVSVDAEALGEAVGPLTLTLTDDAGTEHTAWVHDLLIDLTLPEMEIGRSVLRADGQGESGELAVWAGDGWILGEVGIEIGSERLVRTFEPGRPGTFGTLWDWSLVRFNATELPVGRAEARIWVKDAAGNEAGDWLEILVDANAPSVSLEAPAPASELSGPFAVRASALDPEGEPVWLLVAVGGSVAAEAAGPQAEVWLDADQFAPGETELSVVGVDRAGNRSAAAAAPVTIR